MINLIRVGGRYNAQIEEYEVDTYSEISQISPAPATGSIVRVIATGNTYKLLSDGSWAQFTELSGGYSLPAVTSNDNGKILGVSGGSWDKITPPTELPAVTSNDNGKILGVSSGSWGKIDAPSGLPAVTGSDNGKVLGVSNGAWAVVSAPAGSLVISATATLDGTSFTPTNIDVTPAQLAAAVAAKVPVFMRLVVTVPAEEEGADDIVAVQQIPLSQSIGTAYNFCSTPDVDAEDGLSLIKVYFETDGDSFVAGGNVYQVAVV